MTGRRLPRKPLAFGITRWGPLPETADLFLLWDGPDGGIYLLKGENGPHLPVRHPSASGTYATLLEAERAVEAFVAAGDDR